MRAPLTEGERDAVVAEARSWLKTPYHHQADIKGVGTDCAMILVKIYVGLGIAPSFDPRPYAPQWYLHQSEERYLGWIKKYCDEIEAVNVLPGDIAMFKFGKCVAHGAIVVDDIFMIHAYQPDGAVSLAERRSFDKRLHSYWTPRKTT